MGKELKEQWLAKIKEIGMLKLMLLLGASVLLIVTSMPKDSSVKNKTDVVESQEDQTRKEQQTVYKEKLERQLVEALEQVDGIGKAKVMITLKSSKEIVVNKDKPVEEETIKERDNTGGEREQSSKSEQETTVLITDSNGQSIPYILKEIEPEIAGILVVAQGAEREIVIQEITDACEVLFSVPVHKIKVMKMKDLSK